MLTPEALVVRMAFPTAVLLIFAFYADNSHGSGSGPEKQHQSPDGQDSGPVEDRREDDSRPRRRSSRIAGVAQFPPCRCCARQERMHSAPFPSSPRADVAAYHVLLERNNSLDQIPIGFRTRITSIRPLIHSRSTIGIFPTNDPVGTNGLTCRSSQGKTYSRIRRIAVCRSGTIF